MIKSFLILFILVTGVMSCKQKQQSEAQPDLENHSMQASTMETYKDVKFDDKKDLVCGMPVSAGITDTAHYKGKVHGFCAKECKDEFLKNPASYLATK